MAAGAGISPFRSMVEEALTKTSHDVWLFFGVRAEADIIYRKEFEALAAENSSFHFIPVLSRSDSPGFERGYIQDAFKKLIKPADQDIYVCGLHTMVDEVRQVCRGLGYREEKIHFEKYI